MRLLSGLVFSASSETIFRSRGQIEETFVNVPDNFDGYFADWNITAFVKENENDDLFQEFENTYFKMQNDLTRSDFTEEERKMIKKFKVIKHMILYIQTLPLFGKFCFYGCHCFSKGPKHLLVDAGNGKPIDSADNACRSHTRCHSCAAQDFGNCEVTRGYSFKAVQDSVTQIRYIECLNEIGSCKRSLCECDKALAYDLADVENDWNILHHQRWGQFDQDMNCRIHTKGKDGAARTEKISEPVQDCCGEYPRRFPYHADDGYGRIRHCCAGRTFDPNILECCLRGETKAIGTCPDA